MFKVKKKYDDDIIIIVYGINKNDIGKTEFLIYNNFDMWEWVSASMYEPIDTD